MFNAVRPAAKYEQAFSALVIPCHTVPTLTHLRYRYKTWYVAVICCHENIKILAIVFKFS